MGLPTHLNGTVEHFSHCILLRLHKKLKKMVLRGFQHAPLGPSANQLPVLVHAQASGHPSLCAAASRQSSKCPLPLMRGAARSAVHSKTGLAHLRVEIHLGLAEEVPSILLALPANAQAVEKTVEKGRRVARRHSVKGAARQRDSLAASRPRHLGLPPRTRAPAAPMPGCAPGCPHRAASPCPPSATAATALTASKPTHLRLKLKTMAGSNRLSLISPTSF